MRFAFAILAALLAPAAALAQSSPNLAFGQVPTSTQWNSYFAAKQDYLGVAPLPSSGGTLTGKLTLAPSTLTAAGLNCGAGTAPSTPVNGDLWCTTGGVFARINGSTIALGSTGGTLAVTAGGTGQSSFTANLPILGNGTSALAQGTRSGNTTNFATVSGATSNGACVAFDASGNLVNAGVGACGGTGGAGTVSAATTGQLAVYTASTTVGGVASCANGYMGTNGSSVVACNTTMNPTLSATVTSLGTIASGTWQATVVGAQWGGTGVNNGANTITLGGSFATAGAAVTLTAIGPTNVTLPTSGTLMTQNGTSGGVPYYSSATTTASSGLLTLNAPIVGGGVGSAPFSGTRTGNTTNFATSTGALISGNCIKSDSSGNLVDSGQGCGGATGGAVLLVTLTATNSTVLTDVGSSCGGSGCFTNTYSSYTLQFINFVAATPGASNACQLQVYSGGSFQPTNYINNVGTASYMPCYPVASGANSMGAPGVNGTMTVYNPSASGKAVWIALMSNTIGTVGSPGAVQQFMSGFWNASAPVTGFRAFIGTTAGTPTSSGIASGVIKVYGNP